MSRGDFTLTSLKFDSFVGVALHLNEDIGRHDAVDKLVGQALAKRLSLADKVLLTSGRLSSEILLKAAKQRIPIIVSRSAPTALTIELAERLNVTL